MTAKPSAYLVYKESPISPNLRTRYLEFDKPEIRNKRLEIVPLYEHIIPYGWIWIPTDCFIKNRDKLRTEECFTKDNIPDLIPLYR